MSFRQDASSPLAAYREDPLLLVLTVAAAATSIIAVLLQLMGVIRMPYTLSFVTAPGVIFLLCSNVGRAGGSNADRQPAPGRICRRSGRPGGL